MNASHHHRQSHEILIAWSALAAGHLVCRPRLVRPLKWEEQGWMIYGKVGGKVVAMVVAMVWEMVSVWARVQ